MAILRQGIKRVTAKNSKAKYKASYNYNVYIKKYNSKLKYYSYSKELIISKKSYSYAL